MTRSVLNSRTDVVPLEMTASAWLTVRAKRPSDGAARPMSKTASLRLLTAAGSAEDCLHAVRPTRKRSSQRSSVRLEEEAVYPSRQ